MKRVIVVIWAIILGIVAGFIGAKLDQNAVNIGLSVVVFAIFGLILNFVPEIMRGTEPASHDQDESKQH
ncbi:DUF2929 family protein [Lapidilactobacillus bayanensis]|uniref:DUF2929 family protein n=1 Tax=Lapidilactobacillus bayanensis TaxID=2485998 RepID=UPI0013DE2758|nr:DUF2929 family protein [Lapidilactobacillus bayanensis]